MWGAPQTAAPAGAPALLFARGLGHRVGLDVQEVGACGVVCGGVDGEIPCGDQFVIWGFEPHHLVLHILHSHQHSKFNILKTLLQIAISIYRLQSYSSTRCLQPQDRNLAYKMRFLAT